MPNKPNPSSILIQRKNRKIVGFKDLNRDIDYYDCIPGNVQKFNQHLNRIFV